MRWKRALGPSCTEPAKGPAEATANQRAAAVRAETSLVAALGVAIACTPTATAAEADDRADAAILGEQEPSWQAESFAARTNVYLQDGEGYQSQHGPIQGPGREDAWIIEPQFALGLRQNADIRHDIYLEIDIVSAASPDAVDLVTAASRVTEAATLDVVSTYQAGGDDYSARYGLHIEEHWRSFVAGIGHVARFAEENTVLGFSGNVGLDSFDPLSITGADGGTTTRGAINLNLSLTQVLSATTLLDLSYGFTYQAGTLETTYNSVPMLRAAGAGFDFPYTRVAEKLDDSRIRNAWSARVAQHIPATNSTLKGAYRFYVDDFGLLGHTAELQFYQYLTPWLYLRASYRLHDQDGVKFYSELLPANSKSGDERTADSDLGPFAAREIGGKLVLYRQGAPVGLRAEETIDLSYFYYHRTNDLYVHAMALGYGRKF